MNVVEVVGHGTASLMETLKIGLLGQGRSSNVFKLSSSFMMNKSRMLDELKEMIVRHKHGTPALSAIPKASQYS